MKKNNLWMKLKAGGLALAVIGAGIFGGLDAEKVKAADQPALTVDLSKETGDIIHGAAGFLYGISSEDVPTTNTLVPLKPKVLCTKGALGTEHPYGDALDVAKTFLESGGEQVMMYNSNYYGVFGVTANYRDYAEVLKETIAPAVVEWKKQWNEEHAKDNLRDVDIDKALVYIPINEGTPKNGTNFNEAWKAYYDAIREADPNAGMGNAWNNSGNPDVYAGTEGDKDKDTKLNAEPLKIGNGRNAKVTGTVTVGDGKNSLEVYALSSDATINMNYIQIRKITGGADKTLQSIEVTAPDKTLYDLDEELDTAGMTVTAVYEDGSKEPVSLNDCTIGTMDGSTEGQKTIEVSYTMGETTVKGTFTALVKKLTEKDLYYFTDCGDHNPK